MSNDMHELTTASPDRARPRSHHMRRSPMASKYSMNDRPSWPRRAIVTAGEPYGNKRLHFGHVGGVFVPADFFARFLRDRLGARTSSSPRAPTATARPSWRATASSRRTRATTSPSASMSSPITPARPPSTTTTSAATSTAAPTGCADSQRGYRRDYRAPTRAGHHLQALDAAVLRCRGGHVPQRPPSIGPLPRPELQVREGVRRRVRPGSPV